MDQLKNTLLGFSVLVAVVVAIFIGVNKSQNVPDQRDAAAYGGASVAKETPQGHTYKEREELWHLSEGADVLPLRWFLNLRSTFNNEKVTEPTYLYERLQDKYGVVETSSIGREYYGDKSWNSPMKWVGLSIAWSEPISAGVNEIDARKSLLKDLYLNNNKPVTDDQAHSVLKIFDKMGVRDVAKSDFNGKLEIPMVGTNCAFCHSNLMSFKGTDKGAIAKDSFVEGAPNLLNVRNFFKDMAGAALKTMLSENEMTDYLLRLDTEGLRPLGNDQTSSEKKRIMAKAVAKEFSSDLKGDLKGVPNLFDGEFDKSGIWPFIQGAWLKITFRGDVGTKKIIAKALARKENRKVLAEYYGRFLAMSYQLPYEKVLETPVLAKRMHWIAKLVTPDPKLAATTEGYGRTDAFGRISNGVARTDHELPLIAPVSFPPMWGMKYSNLFHFNGNTNSVIMRNIGQSFGLGALVFGKGDGVPPVDGKPLVSSNLYNLNRLEKHLYNIKYPEWNTLVPDHLKVDTNIKEVRDQVQLGCNVYVQKCMWCHDGGDHVGPTNQLIRHKVFPMKMVQTDPNHNVIQPTPVMGSGGKKTPFRRALFELTKKVKDRYMSDYKVGDARMAQWENREFRGQEHFRDTFLGENFKSQGNWLRKIFGIEAPANYRGPYELKYMALVDADTGKPKAGTYGYIAKTLAGIWATAPYLHNGSVPTLEHLLNPKSSRPNKFYVGCRVYDDKKMGYVYTKEQFEQYGCEASDENHLFDVDEEIVRIRVNNKPYWQRSGEDSYDKDGNFKGKFDERGKIYSGRFTNGNYNGGHAFDWNADPLKPINKGFKNAQVVKDDKERKALLTFLKVLRPSAEYSWDSEAPYEINGTTCTAKAVPLPENY